MKRIISLFSLIYILTACSSSSNEKNLEVSNAKNVNEISDEALNYQLLLDKSEVTWIGSKPAGKHRGTISMNSGNIAVADNKVIGGKIIINLNSLTSTDLKDDKERHDRLVNHLKSDDFFDADNYPEAVFEITSTDSYAPEKDLKVKQEFESEHQPASATDHIVDAPTHRITGNLTMRGTTLSITFPAIITISNNQVKAIAKFNLDRTNWNLKYKDEASVADKTKDRFIYNTINVGFEIIAEVKD